MEEPEKIDKFKKEPYWNAERKKKFLKQQEKINKLTLEIKALKSTRKTDDSNIYKVYIQKITNLRLTIKDLKTQIDSLEQSKEYYKNALKLENSNNNFPTE